MLNEEQIKIADFLLKYLDSRGGKSSKDDYPDELRKKGFDNLEVKALVKILIENLGLVGYINDTNQWIMLTPAGNKAARIGIEKYLDDLEHDKQLDREEKRANIKGNETSIKNSKKAIVIAIVVPIVLALLQIGYQYKYQVNNTGNNGDKHSQIRSHDGLSNFPITREDTFLIEKLKYSLKHDSVFLNEIKLSIKSK